MSIVHDCIICEVEVLIAMHCCIGNRTKEAKQIAEIASSSSVMPSGVCHRRAVEIHDTQL